MQIKLSVISYDDDNDEDTANIFVVANQNGTPDDLTDDTPYLVDDEYIVRTGAGTAEDPFEYEILATADTFDTTEDLAVHLIATAETGGNASGSLTVNNPIANPGTGASFTTTDANGIQVESIGGRGGNGGCTTILLATWCTNGSTGGGAGSVVVNSNASITVLDATDPDIAGIGVLAQSIGGDGGTGGGGFGLIVSVSGSGGNGGNGSDVVVALGPDSSIVTNGDGGHGVYALSKGGNGGAGGSTSGGIAIGDQGGNGGSAGTVTVTNDGTVTTLGTRAHGIYALSTGAGAGSGSESGGIVGIGGNGGGQSNGSTVTVSNSNTINTWGAESMGIVAQSVGGGGGDGGSAGGLFAVGGDAGSGGGSGIATVNNSGSVTTREDGGKGILVQSIGGGGGNGGGAISVNLGASVAVGGHGGLGGAGAAAIYNGTVNGSGVAPTITTEGDRADGIQVQSIGGGGGNGGFTVTAGVAVLGFSVGVSLGGDGGGGNSGSTADVTHIGTIVTGGDLSAGILAQSVGGGGGGGGGAISATAGGIIQADLAMGGSGGSGGSSSTVTVNTSGNITTGGGLSHGVVAQSIGGGGGNGGYAVAAGIGSMSAAVSVGGTGGTGGTGGAVKVNVTRIGETAGTIGTVGDGAIGIVAQSLGGGGGNGGYAVSGAAGAGAITVGVGGSGGGGATASTVKVLNENNISTGALIVGGDVAAGENVTGHNAHGIFAQSIGGGGGNGGFSVAGSGGALAIAVSVGGSGGSGSTGNDVTVDNSGTISTLGNLAHGIFAQSIGGGGGNGGFAVSGTLAISIDGAAGVGVAVGIGGSGGTASHAGAVTVNNSGSIATGSVTGVGEDAVYTGLGSHAIFAQSVGGGGGSGGFAGAVSLAAGAGTNVSAAVAVGGSGAGGGNAGAVNVLNNGTDTILLTTADGADGIHAQSVGGGGGDGGFAFAGAFALGPKPGGAVSVAIGGDAGEGGDSAKVDVDNQGAITTSGKHANAIFAQSIGGGGGNGGFAASLAMAVGDKALTGSVAVGGSGGGGGVGGDVEVGNTKTLTVYGDESYGVFAQSVGGGGGNGGMAISGTIAAAQGDAAGVAVTVGGAGGIGNFGGNVIVTNSGAINTGRRIVVSEDEEVVTGVKSIGIFAQSIGGGGGNGGMALTAQITGSAEGNIGTIGVSVGGGGGSGDAGGDVTVNNLLGGNIHTIGLEAHAIFAQSVGGGGGNGGQAITAQLGLAGRSGEEPTTTVTAAVTVGGGGGTGDVGGHTIVDNDATIEVEGAGATGIFAQSIGGGGGNGGNAITAVGVVTDTTNDSSKSFTADVTIGGGGGDGDNGGAVDVNNSGGIKTHGASGFGIFAQSVGGGGGIGGRANTIAMVVTDECTIPGLCDDSPANKNNYSLGVSVGGDGGVANHGGDVEVINTGNIETLGDTSDGIYAQSIGGGGGNGGNGILGSAEILPIPAELLVILPIGSVSIHKDFTIAVGGNAGAGGNGGVVDVDNTGSIITRGGNSNGIFAQSVGKGGGVGGKAVIGATGKLGLGGEGDNAGSGGNVAVTQAAIGDIETFGVSSNGIFAQSVGGGGGIAGNVDRALAADIETPLGTIPGLNLGVGLALGRSSGAGGNGGAVDVAANGDITTHGDSSAGIFAQSVGGGGGLLGGLGNAEPVLNLMSWQIGSKGDDGDAGAVSVDLTGTIRTAGNNATGIFAQSAGGLAKLSDDPDADPVAANSGDVTVTVSGSVLTAENLLTGDEARGMGSIAILAHSAADTNAANGNVIIDINDTDTIIRGGRTGAVGEMGYVGVGVWIMDGKTNTIDNAGTITTADGVDAGWAILATGSDATHLGGDEAVSNFGTVTGSIALGVGTNSFVNETTGKFNSGAFATYGDGNLLTNNGWMSTGGTNRVMTTAFNGDLTQSATGIYGVDLDLDRTGLAGEADLIDIDGTLTVDGAVDLTLLNMGNALPGEHEVVIARSETKLVGGIELNTAASLVVTYEMFKQANLLPGIDTELVLSYAIDFDIDGLNPNQSAIGQYVNAFQLAGGSDGLEPLVASLIQIPDLETYQALLDQLSPEPYLINQTLAMLAGLQFENSLMSCKVQDGFDAEGQCAWASVNHRKTERAENSTNLGFEQTSFGLSAGAQAKIDDHFVAGIGGSWEDIGTESNGSTSSSGNRFQGGAVFKGVWDGTVLAGAITGGWSSQNVSRFVDLPLGPSYVLEGTQDIGFASAHVRLSHSFEQDNWYVRPMVDVGVTQVSVADFAETGGPTALEIDGHDQTYVTVAPSIELGGEMDVGNDAVLRSFIRVGALDVLLGTNPEILAGFADAPDEVAPFTIVGDLDEALFDVTMGFDVINGSGAVVRLSGDAKVGETIKSYGGSLKISAPF
ncbi:autotransporter outer membrane beta-barrel domain-containing protein [Devosia sp.]|uniref:autotransporter outer membrane beta-barrel domain-containing protein n=1 Tax=Devosia sp. TaxID=1871048 RepID=UPI00260E24F8|nr:autotransporter outer membrane beta-barrel domain-containing protein [Devosia sp.]